MRWIKDEEFVRGNIPMTKFDIRIIAIGLLSVEKGDMFLDIGAGTGSVSVEAALQGAEVWAVEREREGVELVEKNSEKFNADINVIEGEAPKDLPPIEFNKCFIGGSGGKLEEIFDYLDENLLHGGIVCANFITLKNLNEFLRLLDVYEYKDVEVKLIQSANMNNIGMLKGNNPIFIAKGVKR
jgi:cobalt-precorrin-6B (C15)-methyltransferase